MNIKKLSNSEAFTAGDKTQLRELWNPHNDPGFTGRYSLAHATLRAGQSSEPHTLDVHELYYILSGEGKIYVDSDERIVESGDAIEIRPGSKQWIRNTGKSDLVFLCVVDPAWTPDIEQVD